MLPIFPTEALNIAVLVLIAVWSFPAWGERMLRLKEHWDAYRHDRQHGKESSNPGHADAGIRQESPPPIESVKTRPIRRFSQTR
jgi:hypothetical protein